MQYDKQLALKNWPTSCPFNLAQKELKNVLNGNEMKVHTIMHNAQEIRKQS